MTGPIAYRENDGRSWRCDGCGSHGRAMSPIDGHRIAAETVAAHVAECTPAATEPTLTLFSADLLSKWGFNDGDDPDDWLDYCEAHGIDYNAVTFPLAALVRRHLLPVLDQTVTVVDVETSHNPIRVDTVDGQDVTEVWHGRAPAPTLTPEYVNIPMSEVARLARR